MFTELLLSLGVAALPVVGGFVGTAITNALKSRNLDTTWFEAVSRAGGVAYNTLLATGGSPSDRSSLFRAAATGAGYLMERLPEQTATRALTRPMLTDIVAAELGRLLAHDPTVGPAPLPAPRTQDLQFPPQSFPPAASTGTPAQR